MLHVMILLDSRRKTSKYLFITKHHQNNEQNKY